MNKKSMRAMMMQAALAAGLILGSAAAPRATAAAPEGPASAPPAAAGDLTRLPADVMPLVQMLHDRRNTLKDFTAKIDYSVYHPVSDDESGKQGTVHFINDPAKGPIFSVDFTDNTDAGVPNKKYHQQVIFDGVYITTLDYVVKEFTHTKVLPDGAKPGEAVNLNGPLPLPVGIDPAQVARSFDVTLIANPKDAPPDTVTLRLVPREGTKFDFKQMDILIDKKLELPVRLIQTAKNKDVTTIRLTDIQTNTGTAKMVDSNPPVGEKWTERKLQNDQGGAGAGGK